MTGYDPYKHADQLGIEVIHRPLSRKHGLWLPEHNLIVIREGMRVIHDRSTLTHEIGHAILGHVDDRPKHETQADRWAAKQLINPVKLCRIAAWTDDPARIAAELGVATRLVQVFLASEAPTLAPSLPAIAPGCRGTCTHATSAVLSGRRSLE